MTQKTKTKKTTGIDYDLAERTAAGSRNRKCEVAPEDGFGQLADDLYKYAVTARAATAGWMGVQLPPEQECPVIVADFDQILRAQVTTLRAGASDCDKTSKLLSKVSGWGLAVGINRSNAFFHDQDPAGGAPTLFVNAPRLAYLAVAATQYNLTLAHLAMSVCIHEEAHRLHFLIAPWMTAERKRLMAEIEQARNSRDWNQYKASRKQMIALGSLIEGYGIVAEFEAMPEQPVDKLAEFFGRKVPLREKAIRRLAAAKVKQYSQGRQFVKAAATEIGWDAFNAAAWAGPANIPTPAEILDPVAWCRRVQKQF